MATVEAIRKITIQSSSPGVDQTTAALLKLAASQQQVATAADALTKSIGASQAMIDKHVQSINHMSAANDNAKGGIKGLIDGFNTMHHTTETTVENILNTINHLKLLAVALYAMSPAVRSFVNADIAKALGLVSAQLPGVATAAASTVRYLSPMLSFFAGVTLPIGAAVLAWKGLNAVWDQGSSLLTKYANAERSLFSSEAEDKLKTMVKYQSDTISAAQVAYAEQLGTQLAQADKTIHDFLTVQLDLTDPALRLQEIWVDVVSAVASAVTEVNKLLALIGQIPGALGMLGHALAAIPGIGLPFLALQELNGLTGGPPQTAASLADARSRLGALMGVKNVGTAGAPIGDSFAARWAADFSTADKSTSSSTTNSYERALQGIKDQIDQLKLEAAGAAKTSQAVEELKVAHTLNIAAMRAGIPVTEEMATQWKAWGDQVAALTIQINRMKVLQDATFKGMTQFMSSSQQAAASAARQIDPTNWMAHLNDAGPRMAAFNSELAQANGLAYNFVDTFTQGLEQGKTRTQALTDAMKNLESQLLQMAEKQAINQLFASLWGLFKPAGAGVLPGGVGASPYANGGAFDGGNVIPFAGGGVVNSPTLFPFANGTGLMGEAGPEAILPLKRGAGGRLGVAASGGGVINNFIVENHTGSKVSQSKQRNSSGGFDHRVIIRSDIASGQYDDALRKRFQLLPQKVR